ncbi:MAG: hypothetical protein M1399_03375 [Actinobacteria bacterium]|nr:hypothetical protein [Actinomycetota bacterium]MCL5446514.1 hypothetical protein [Actinomycetota bacterium]
MEELAGGNRKVIVVVNPQAALNSPDTGNQDRRHPMAGRVCDMLERAGYAVTVIDEPTADGMVSHLANELSSNDGSLARYAAIAVVGGDGTVSMIAAMLAYFAGKLPVSSQPAPGRSLARASLPAALMDTAPSVSSPSPIDITSPSVPAVLPARATPASATASATAADPAALTASVPASATASASLTASVPVALTASVPASATASASLTASVPVALPPPLLIIPGGTGNSVYKSIWNDTSWEDTIWRMAKVGGNAMAIRYIDLGWIEELQTPFILGASAGIFSAILERSISMAGISGRARYEQAAMKVMGVFEPFEAEIRVDGLRLAAGRFVLVAVGGARHRGGMLPVLPLSDLADGLLDVCAVPAAGRDDVMGVLLKIASGEHLSEPGVRYAKGSAVEIVSPHPLPLEHDGEIDTQELYACHIAAVPGAVPVVSPLAPLLG